MTNCHFMRDMEKMSYRQLKCMTGTRDHSKAREDGENHERPDYPVIIKSNDSVVKVRIHVRTGHCWGIRTRVQEMNTDEHTVRQILGTYLNIVTELCNLCRNQLRIMIMTGPLTGHCHLKGHLIVLGLVGSYGCDRWKRDLKQPHMFFVNVRHWWYKDSGTLAITSWNQLTVLTSLSARYCTLFKVRGSWMLLHTVAQKNGKDQEQE